ncbi:stage II sporulation protein Q [Amphibacillus marinus]|uniref:Stage II sporulation protein Q n=1 Tax=Amphibacillus marinus TaxID=872970 RepID=A0A1H8N316_9BACI|nr:M23 family metallopeptidase [Amphibacillus marinus]SEO23906.1 stage II sporulation protein Q [Amphibacillus marinus]
MKEEKRGLSYHWKRLIKKKGFYPAVYLAVAALLLTGVLWYQNMDRIAEPETGQGENLQDQLRGENPYDFDEPSDMVTNPVENVSLPVLSESATQIVTKFYDFDKEQADQEQALVFYGNKFYQSQGIDIAATTSEPLPVVAALSGEVVEVKEDPVLGYVVQIAHDHDLVTYYSSLTAVEVEPGQKVSQGEFIANAGTSDFGKDNGIHVHFEIRKEGKAVNPEAYLERPVTDIVVDQAEQVTEDQSDEQENPDPELESGRTTTHS